MRYSCNRNGIYRKYWIECSDFDQAEKGDVTKGKYMKRISQKLDENDTNIRYIYSQWIKIVLEID